MAKPKIPKKMQKKNAKKQISYFFKLIQNLNNDQSTIQNRYIFLIRKLAMKLRLKLTKEQKRKFCNHCHNYFTNKSLRVRTARGKVVYYCLRCKKHTRIPYSKKIKKIVK